MKKLLLMLCAVGGVMAVLAKPPENAVMVSGNLKRADGTVIPTDVSFSMIFRIYDSPGGTNVYWGRKMPVAFKENGDFTVKLQDESGTPVANTKYSKLEQCGELRDWHIGIQPEGCREIPGRVHIARQFFALHADSAAEVSNLSAEVIETDDIELNGKLFVNNLQINQAHIRAATTKEDGKAVSLKFVITPNGELSIAALREVTLNGNISGIFSHDVRHDANVEGRPSNGLHNLKSDTFILGYNWEKKSYFSIPRPAGKDIDYKCIPYSAGQYYHILESSRIYQTSVKDYFPYWPNIFFRIYSFGKQDW